MKFELTMQGVKDFEHPRDIVSMLRDVINELDKAFGEYSPPTDTHVGSIQGDGYLKYLSGEWKLTP